MYVCTYIYTHTLTWMLVCGSGGSLQDMVVKAFEELMGGDSGVAVADITGYHICMYVCMCMFKISIFISIYLLLLRTSPGTMYVCIQNIYIYISLSLSLSLYCSC